MIRILLVDDHPVVRHGIRTIIMDRLKGAVVGEAANAVIFAPAGGQRRVGCRIADISLPGAGGLALIKDLSSCTRPCRRSC